MPLDPQFSKKGEAVFGLRGGRTRRVTILQDMIALSVSDAILVVVPVYNHAATLRQVVTESLTVHPHVLVVDDGSTDMPSVQATIPENPLTTQSHPLCGLPVHFVRHAENRGKGVAIKTAAAEAKRLGMTHIITLDADGQHCPQEIVAFVTALGASPCTVFVGNRDFTTENVPFSSRFGRAFSNFWFKVQTEQTLADTQCGFRAYPLAVLEAISCSETHYSFEVEVLVRAAWAGFSVQDVPVSVYYPPASERISHFKPLTDNIRITLLNTRLTIRAIMPVPQKKFLHDAHGRVTPLHPLKSLRMLLADNATPANLALASALGICIGTLPLIGLHSILILLAAGALRLNKIMALAASQLCIPPFVPALCIEMGYFLRKGYFLTDISLQTLGMEAVDRLVDWTVGAFVTAPMLAAAIGCVTFLLAKAVQLRMVAVGNTRIKKGSVLQKK